MNEGDRRASLVGGILFATVALGNMSRLEWRNWPIVIIEFGLSAALLARFAIRGRKLQLFQLAWMPLFLSIAIIANGMFESKGFFFWTLNAVLVGWLVLTSVFGSRDNSSASEGSQ